MVESPRLVTKDGKIGDYISLKSWNFKEITNMYYNKIKEK